MHIKEIQKMMVDFCLERNWLNENPVHLLNAAQIELSELSEIFQWQDTFKDQYTEDEKTQIAYEIVDILNYVLRIVDQSGIKDIGPYYKEKMEKLEVKFALDKDHAKQKELYRKTGKNKLYK